MSATSSHPAQRFWNASCGHAIVQRVARDQTLPMRRLPRTYIRRGAARAPQACIAADD